MSDARRSEPEKRVGRFFAGKGASMVDWHVHTTASDGDLTPREVVRKAARDGVTDLAITDHDTQDGVEEAREEGERLRIRVVPGVELSCCPPRIHNATARTCLDVHILGYRLSAKAATLLRKRHTRTNSLWPADVAVEFIHRHGGIAILAHCGRNSGFGDFDWLAEHWLPIDGRGPLGLDGLEVFHPSHDEGFSERLLRFARERKAIVTGGSDYHTGSARLGCPQSDLLHPL